MKTIIVLSLFITLGFASCDQKVSQQKICEEYSIKCEILKDNYLLFPLEASSEVTDVYGEPIITNSYQWYFVNSKHKVLAPCGINYTNTPYPTVEAFLELFGSNIKIDTVNFTGLKALIVLTGSGEIQKGSALNNPYFVTANVITP